MVGLDTRTRDRLEHHVERFAEGWLSAGDRRAPLFRTRGARSGVVSVGALVGMIQTLRVSQFFGCRPLGPVRSTPGQIDVTGDPPPGFRFSRRGGRPVRLGPV